METLPSSNSDQQVIINLLTEQNQTLHQILAFHQHQEKVATRKAIFTFVLHAIPYIALAILIYFVYVSIKGYLDAMNNDIKSIHDNVTSITDSVRNLPSAIGDSIKNNLNSLSTGITSLFK